VKACLLRTQCDNRNVGTDESTICDTWAPESDTATTVTGTGSDLDRDYTDSNALARVLASSPTVRECMARQLFRASTGHAVGAGRAPEDRFVTVWRQLPADKQGSLMETLVAWVRSDGFVARSTGP